MFWKLKKGEVEMDEFFKWAIAIAVLIIVGVGYFVLSGKADGAIAALSQKFNAFGLFFSFF